MTNSCMQQRHVLTVMLFVALAIAFAERGILPMTITRMVAIPNQSANDKLTSNETICTSPHWAPMNQSSLVNVDIIDQAVSRFCHYSEF